MDNLPVVYNFTPIVSVFLFSLTSCPTFFFQILAFQLFDNIKDGNLCYCMCYYRYVFFLFVCLLVFFLFSRLPERHKLVRRPSKDIVFWRTLSSHPIHFFLCVRGRCFGLGPFRSLRKVNYWQAQAKLPAWKASDFLLSISLIHFSFCFCFVLFCLWLFCFLREGNWKQWSRPVLAYRIV